MSTPITMPAFVLKVEGQDLYLVARQSRPCQMVSDLERVLRSDAVWWSHSAATRYAQRVNDNLLNGCNCYINDDFENPIFSKDRARPVAIKVGVVALSATFSVA